MKKILKHARRSSTKKDILAKDLADLYDQKRRLEEKIKALKSEVQKTFVPGQKVGRVQLVDVKNKVVTHKLEKELKKRGIWDDVLADPKVSMRKLSAVLKSFPDLQGLLKYDPSTKVVVSKVKRP